MQYFCTKFSSHGTLGHSNKFGLQVLRPTPPLPPVYPSSRKFLKVFCFKIPCYRTWVLAHFWRDNRAFSLAVSTAENVELRSFQNCVLPSTCCFLWLPPSDDTVETTSSVMVWLFETRISETSPCYWLNGGYLHLGVLTLYGQGSVLRVIC